MDESGGSTIRLMLVLYIAQRCGFCNRRMRSLAEPGRGFMFELE